MSIDTTLSEETTTVPVSTLDEGASPSGSDKKKPKKNPKPLRLLVHPALMETKEVEALAAKGHTVVNMSEVTGDEFDLILGANCWRMTSVLIKHLQVAVKSAREVKYKKPTPKEGAE